MLFQHTVLQAGAWVNAKLFTGVTWPQIIRRRIPLLCVVFQRIVRLTMDRQRGQFLCGLTLFAGMAFACLIVSSDSRANDTWDIQLSEQELKRIADGTLTLMAFSVLPDISTSSLSINKGAADDPGIWQSTFGGGFTVGKDYPLYLEGSFGYSRYDPDFIATRGQEQRQIPLKWNSFAATGGIGWGFPLTPSKELTLRPIFNFTLGYVTTDVALGQDLLTDVPRYFLRENKY